MNFASVQRGETKEGRTGGHAPRAALPYTKDDCKSFSGLLCLYHSYASTLFRHVDSLYNFFFFRACNTRILRRVGSAESTADTYHRKGNEHATTCINSVDESGECDPSERWIAEYPGVRRHAEAFVV